MLAAFKAWLMEALEFNGLLLMAEYGDEDAAKMVLAKMNLAN